MACCPRVSFVNSGCVRVCLSKDSGCVKVKPYSFKSHLISTFLMTNVTA